MPTITQRQDGQSSRESVNSGGRTTSTALSGKPRITATFPDQWFDFALFFTMLSASEKDALDQFYRANLNGDVDFTYIHDGFGYNGYFTDLPLISRQGPDIFTVSFSIRAKRVIV